MGLHLTVVDAFTDTPFHGNPAAVALVDAFPADERMQLIAREINLAETAFVAARPDGDHDLRWFTPEVEVDLCGHATLASAHVLGRSARFHTRSGVLACAPGPSGRIEMDFPADPLDVPDPDTTGDLAGVLGDPGVVEVGRGRTDLLVVLDEAAAVRRLRPDLAGVAALGTRCVIVTAAGDRAGIDCVSRVFGPNVGINEDPVTGSAHTTLAGYWAGRTGRLELVGEQASARGGVVHMRLAGERVVLGGHAVTVSEIHLLA